VSIDVLLRTFGGKLAVVILALLPWLLIAFPLPGQTSSDDVGQSQNSQTDPGLTTFRVTTREVLVDLIALDRHNQPVLDLKPDELQVSERAEPGRRKSPKCTRMP